MLDEDLVIDLISLTLALLKHQEISLRRILKIEKN